MTETRPTLCTTLITVTTAFMLMLLAGVLEVSVSVQPPTWMQRGGRALHDSHPAKMHVQSLSSAQEVLAAEETFSRRKLQVLTIACPMHSPLPSHAGLQCTQLLASSSLCPLAAPPSESCQLTRECPERGRLHLQPHTSATVWSVLPEGCKLCLILMCSMQQWLLNPGGHILVGNPYI